MQSGDGCEEMCMADGVVKVLCTIMNIESCG